MADDAAPGSPLPTRHTHTTELAVLLTPAMQTRLAEAPVRAYLREKYEKEAAKRWNDFYNHNTTHFFKDRHWILREFPLLRTDARPGTALEPGASLTFLEAGCGVGNTVFPLLAECPHMFAYACDFSQRAVELVKEHPEYGSGRCKAFCADLTRDALIDTIPGAVVDVASLFFCLSAVAPTHFAAVVANMAGVVRPGGAVIFRDYGLYDHAMLRFKPGQKLEDRFYVRGDGTRAFYFTTEELCALFAEGGFITESCVYVKTDIINRKLDICAPRIFVQGTFRRVAHGEAPPVKYS